MLHSQQMDDFFFHILAWRQFGTRCSSALMSHRCPLGRHLMRRSLRTFKFLSALAKLLQGWLVVLSLSPIKALKWRMSASSKSFVQHGFTPHASQKEPLFIRAAAELTQLAWTLFFFFFALSLKRFVHFLVTSLLMRDGRRLPWCIVSNPTP